MKLHKVQIANFRSIKYLEFILDKDFKILVGKNESGKTNILKALSLLDKESSLKLEDLREPLPDETSSEEAYLRFVFHFNEAEQQEIIKALEGLFSTDKKLAIIKFKSKTLTLSEFVAENCSAVYQVGLSGNRHTYWTVDKEYKFIDAIKTPSNYIRLDGIGQKKPENYLFVHEDFLSKENLLVSKPGDFDAFYTLLGKQITSMAEKAHPKVTYWKYDENNLLPANVNIAEFSNNPNICIPLKNLFHLAGMKNISEEITTAQKGSPTKLRNLLERVSEHATKHFRETWKEYKTVSFSLTPNGANIDAGIKERNTYTFEQRSDGFKRFMSFLLKLSADNKNKELKDDLILVDEPDISLHPSGIKYLRDELERISKNNIVVASTHSIFMIDENCIERHYIVKKEMRKH